MPGLILTAGARDRIARLLLDSGMESPTASLGRQSEPVKLPPDLVRAAVTGDERQKLQAFAENKAGVAKYALEVFVLEAADCRVEDLRDISGLRFCISAPFMALFDGHVLDVKDGRFCVIRIDGKPIEGPLRDLLFG